MSVPLAQGCETFAVGVSMIQYWILCAVVNITVMLNAVLDVDTVGEFTEKQKIKNESDVSWQPIA